MKTLWSVNAFVFILISCNNFVCKNAPTDITADHKVISGFSDTLNVVKFKTRINLKKAELSGILIYKKMNDSTSAGSFINEFGLKGFDFTVDRSRARLGYVFRNLDKSYIRKTLETDLHFMLSKPKYFTICLINNTSAAVSTISNYLHYVYYFPKNKYFEKADMYRRARKISSLQQYYTESEGFVIKMEHNNGTLRYELSEIKN